MHVFESICNVFHLQLVNSLIMKISFCCCDADKIKRTVRPNVLMWFIQTHVSMFLVQPDVIMMLVKHLKKTPFPPRRDDEI